MQLFVSAFCLLCSLSLASPDAVAADTSPLRVKVTPRQHTVNSHLNGQHYALSVSLPPNYDRDIGHAYPVLYVLDGQAQFTRVVGRYLNLYYQGRMPALILVGIGWQPDANSEAWLADGEQPDFSVQRARDFSPFPTPGQADSGRAALFLNVLRTEIIPAIEIQYRTAAGQRALYGHDQAGLFGYYALFQSAGLFTQYLLTAPALVNATLALTLEGQYAGQSEDLPAQLFIATPDSEQALRQQITDKLASRHYPRLAVQGVTAEGDAALDRGLGYLFTPVTQPLPADALASYAGRYRFDDQQQSELILRDGQLFLTASGPHPELPLLCIGRDRFRADGVYLQLQFSRDEQQQISGLMRETLDGQRHASKLR